MPKAPITYRETFFSVVRGGGKDYLGHTAKRQLDWNVVETELGTMVEPRTCSLFEPGGKVVNSDSADMSISKITMIEESDFQNQYGTGGASLVDFNA